MCLKTADVASEDVWGIMLTWRGRSLVHVHTARALFFIILIILKAKLIFLIYLISTPRRASCKIYQNPRTKRAGFLGWVRLSHQHIIIKRRFQNPYHPNSGYMKWESLITAIDNLIRAELKQFFDVAKKLCNFSVKKQKTRGIFPPAAPPSDETDKDFDKADVESHDNNLDWFE